MSLIMWRETTLVIDVEIFAQNSRSTTISNLQPLVNQYSLTVTHAQHTLRPLRLEADAYDDTVSESPCVATAMQFSLYVQTYEFLS